MRRLPPQPRVLVVGHSGLVGQELMGVLRQRHFPGPKPATASPRDPEASLRTEADLVFLAAPEEFSRRWAPQWVECGAVVIDLSAAWRFEAPLVIPEVNGMCLQDHRGLIASPNCTNVPLSLALHALREFPWQRVDVVGLLAASGLGRRGLQAAQGGDELHGQPLEDNLIAWCGEDGGGQERAEEVRLREETRRILQQPELRIESTCIRTPIARGHALQVSLESAEPLSLEPCRQALRAMPGLHLPEDTEVPHLVACVGGDEVFANRVRLEESGRHLRLWLCCDNLRKGAAVNAVRIAEALLPAGEGAQ